GSSDALALDTAPGGAAPPPQTIAAPASPEARVAPMKALGVIPARIGATRFPAKPLALLKGRPLVLHVLDRARECDALDGVVVATDSAEIARVVEESGGEAMMTSAAH